MGNSSSLRRLRANDASLTTLSLRDNQIGDEGATALADDLKYKTLLTRLDLSCNHIGVAGTTALADALKYNTVLTRLDLYHNQIGDEDATALADALKYNTVLTTLDLSFNHIGDAGTTALADALKYNKVLTTVDLRWNKIGVKGTTALANALEHNTVLTTLDLFWFQIGVKGTTALKRIKELIEANRNGTQKQVSVPPDDSLSNPQSSSGQPNDTAMENIETRAELDSKIAKYEEFLSAALIDLTYLDLDLISQAEEAERKKKELEDLRGSGSFPSIEEMKELEQEKETQFRACTPWSERKEIAMSLIDLREKIAKEQQAQESFLKPEVIQENAELLC